MKTVLEFWCHLAYRKNILKNPNHSTKKKSGITGISDGGHLELAATANSTSNVKSTQVKIDRKGPTYQFIIKF